MEQINLFDYAESIISKSKAKQCECGNTHLAIRYTGCGKPLDFIHLSYEQYLFCVFCPRCFNVATCSYGWRSNKLTLENAVRDWNTYPHRNDKKNALGRYGHQWYADRMKETREMFPEIKEWLGE